MPVGHEVSDVNVSDSEVSDIHVWTYITVPDSEVSDISVLDSEVSEDLGR